MSQSVPWRRCKVLSVPIILVLAFLVVWQSSPLQLAFCKGIAVTPGRRAVRFSVEATSAASQDDLSSAGAYIDWARSHGATISSSVAAPEAGGLQAASDLIPRQVIATVPQSLALHTEDLPGWEARLTLQALCARFRQGSGTADAARQPWIASWKRGGWATYLQEADDPRMTIDRLDFANVIGGCLLTTGSNNDVEIYRKFGLPCHPVVDRAAIRLSTMSGASKPAARAALEARGYAFRACRDDLAPLVDLDDPSTPTDGSLRERRLQQVARYFSLTLARAAKVAEHVIVAPFHELLHHCGSSGENTELMIQDGDIKLMASRAVAAGEVLTRDYTAAPRLAEAPAPQATPTGGSRTLPAGEDDSELRLLLQSGLPLWELGLGAYRN